MGGITGSVLLFLLSLISLTDGEFAFTIVASDPEGDPMTFVLSGPEAGYFRVEANTGNVYVQRALDRESTSCNVFQANPRTITIILEDANDNKPLFDSPSYDKSVPENTTVGTILFKVTAHDADFGVARVVKYSIAEVTPNSGASPFTIGEINGEVKLTGPLNYTGLSTYYQLKIAATDGGGKCHLPAVTHQSFTFSFISVVDVADLDPVFTGTPYIGKVNENSPLAFSVFQVTARDQDLQVNDRMIYSIESSTPDGLFQIAGDTGIISVKSEIDREVTGDIATLTVKATEANPNIHGVQASVTTNVQINIIDENDNTPKFYKCDDIADKLGCVAQTHFTGEILEHSLGSVPINMMVNDSDKMPQTQLSLGGTHKDVFSVEPQLAMSESIVQILVKEPQKLDFEKIQQMFVEVIAVDGKDDTKKATATVTITIKDINDNSPQFPQDTYMLNVTEHSPDETVIATITADDPDTMDEGNITYRLLPESILTYFDVEPKTGRVYVKNGELLDREARSLFSVTLQARDTSGKPGSTVLEITVTDINDQAPVMNRDSYLEFVKEGSNFELKIEMADDPSTVNSKILFSIEPSKYSNNFTIDPNTGVLRNKGELDREALDPKMNGRIELNVTATDKGTPPLSTTVPVIINIEDVNDNKPHFENSSYTFSVKEGEKGAHVGSVYAEDLDQTIDFNRISFSIIDGSFGSFIIRSFPDERGFRGDITVDPDIELDYESARKQYKLRVLATDLEQEEAEVMVDVSVLDVNDERPEFKPSDPVTVKENTTITEVVGSFEGMDKDGNHSLVYKLESMKCRCNGSLTPCSNFILDPTGKVRLNPEKKLDYEQCDQVIIEAQVEDEFTEKGENNSATTGILVINIEDINDNAPEFIYSDAVFVVVSESASKGTSVAGVTATDRDSAINRQIEFKVTTVQFVNTDNVTSDMRTPFEAVTTQQKDIYVGIIQTTEPLNLELKGKYLVTVTATDSGRLSTSTKLDIFSIDESYKITLEFTRSEADVIKDKDEITRASEITIVMAYFVYPNGTALTDSQVTIMLSEPEYHPTLAQLGLKNIGPPPVVEVQTDPVKFVLMGMVGGLLIVLAVLTTSLLCTRRNYGRKLKAAKAMNSAAMVTSDNQKSGPVVPGTNKYTMEGANPVLNLNYDTAMVLGLDGESSDVDKVSLNSLDYSDYMSNENETKSTMHMIEEEEEDNGPPEYIEPLGAALAQQGKKKTTGNADMSLSNPAFDTTDL
ncbi:Cadherin-related family member 2 [Collichthys lucidus]|uniref:Cadherin-related family member 2 n=1 Tax=Collichthys lucidus TaxID=240159 RepID=A0A4U5UEQ8_COLLU|nr:Cadherin-related family member 2 [Collichthys lucidus]